MSFYRGMTRENVTIKGDKGTPITAYVAKPSGAGPFPGVVLIHHAPGWSEYYIETTRRFAHHGYLAICANLYERDGGSDANPDDVGAKVRARAASPTRRWSAIRPARWRGCAHSPIIMARSVLSAPARAARHTFIYACQRNDIDAAVEQWGGNVVMAKEDLNAKKPVAAIDMTNTCRAPCSASSATTIVRRAPSR